MSDLSLWLYKRYHPITFSSELTDYQIYLDIYYGSGESTGSSIYLNELCKSDYGDIRFVSSSGAELPYYVIPTIYADHIGVWVKVDRISSDSYIWIYYGNSDATSTSSGDDTFELFDTFSGSFIDATKWNVVANNGSSVTVSNNKANFSCATPVFAASAIYSKQRFGPGYAVIIQDFIMSNPGDNKPYKYTKVGFGLDDSNSTRVLRSYDLTIVGDCAIFVDDSDSNKSIYTMALDWYSGGASPWVEPVESSAIYEVLRASDRSFVKFRMTWDSLGIDTVERSISSAPAKDLPILIGIDASRSSPASAVYTASCNGVYVRKYATSDPVQSAQSGYIASAEYPLKIELNPDSGTVPLTVQFNILSEFPLENFTLSYGDNNEYSGENVTSFATTHIYDTPGTYTVWGEGYTEFATHVYYEIPYGVTVNAESVVASFSVDQTYNVLQFTNTSTGNPNEFYWLFGDGTSSYETSPVYTFHSTGTHTVTLYSSNQYQYDVATTNVTVSQLLVPPQAFFIPNEYNVISPTLPYNITFTNLSTPSFGNTYLWTIDGTTYTTEDVTHSFATYGFYDVALTVSNALGSDTKSYDDHIKLTRKGKTFYEVIGYADTFSTFGVIAFPTEYMTATDTIIHANIFDENVKFVQSEVPATAGVDEWGYRNLYSTINEWGHMVIDTLTEWGHRIIHPASANDHKPMTFFRTEIFEETVMFNDEWQFGTE